MRRIMTVGIAVLLLAGCGGDGSGEATTPAAEPTTAVPAAATLVTELATKTTELTTKTDGGLATELTEGLRYHAADAPFATKSGAVDVISPARGEAYPTVVVFHGDPNTASKGWHRSDAQLIAEQGRVVFLPAWGHTEASAVSEMGLQRVWEMTVREVSCAVLFAQAHTEEYGGDPEHITLYGLSAGGNAVLMAGLAEADPLDSCIVSGEPVQPTALVPIEADWTLGGDWDVQIRENPELFYAMTPWRHMDGSQGLPIQVMVAEITGSYTRSVEPDPATSWLSYRHLDVDLVADLEERGYLVDGEFSLRASGEYAVEILQEAGYDATLVVMPGASHDRWGSEGTAAVVETVVGTGQR